LIFSADFAPSFLPHANHGREHITAFPRPGRATAN